MNRFFAYFVLLLFVLLQAYNAVLLNGALSYQIGPSPEAALFGNKVAVVMGIAGSQGFFQALQESLTGGMPFFPLAIAAFLGTFLPAGRLAGVLIESLPLSLLAGSACFYFIRCRQLSPFLAVVFSMALVSFGGVYQAGMGLGGFAFGLLYYSSFGLAAIWLLIAREINCFWVWSVTGLFFILAFLTWVAAPLVLVLIFAPFLALRFFLSPREGRGLLVLKMALAVAITVVGTLWFAVLQGWGKDLTEKLQIWNLWESTDFSAYPAPLVQVFFTIGAGLWVCAFLVFLSQWISNFDRSRGWFRGIFRLALRLDLEGLYLAVVPLTILLFVNKVWVAVPLFPLLLMIPVFGILLFFLLPVREKIKERNWMVAWVGVLCLSGSFFQMIHGLAILSVPSDAQTNRMSAYRDAIAEMLEKSREIGNMDFSFGIPSRGEFSPETMTYVLTYAYGYRPKAGRLEGAEGTIAVADPRLSPHSLSDWRALGGSDDEETLRRIVDYYDELDYLFLPTVETIDYLEHAFQEGYINGFLKDLRGEYQLGGNWIAFGKEIAVSKNEKYRVYENTLKEPPCRFEKIGRDGWVEWGAKVYLTQPYLQRVVVSGYPSTKIGQLMLLDAEGGAYPLDLVREDEDGKSTFVGDVDVPEGGTVLTLDEPVKLPEQLEISDDRNLALRDPQIYILRPSARKLYATAPEEGLFWGPQGKFGKDFEGILRLVGFPSSRFVTFRGVDGQGEQIRFRKVGVLSDGRSIFESRPVKAKEGESFSFIRPPMIDQSDAHFAFRHAELSLISP